MSSPEAIAKLRAVLDYIPEEAARLLPGDEQAYYDALTRRLHRSVAVKTQVRRKVIVEQPEEGPIVEPPGQLWLPPPPVEAAMPLPAAAPAPAATWTGMVEAAEPAQPAEEPLPEVPEEPEGDAGFDMVNRRSGPLKVRPVEPDVNLSEGEWRQLGETPEVAEEVAEAPAVAGHGEEDAFEEVLLPAEGEPSGGELRPGPHGEVAEAEFEVEEEGTLTDTQDFEVVEEEEVEVGEGQEPPYQVNEFTLYRRESPTKSGKARVQYFFAAEPAENAQPSPLPEGYEVVVNETSGVPVVRKSLARWLPIIEIEGLGPMMAERLERAGIHTTKELMRVDPRKVAGETDISERLLANFRAMSELLQIQGLYPDQAAALVYAGVRNLRDLAQGTAADIAKGMNEAAKDHQLQLRGKMTASRVRSWQEAAKKLQR